MKHRLAGAWLLLISMGCSARLDLGTDRDEQSSVAQRGLVLGGDTSCRLTDVDALCWGRDDFGQTGAETPHDDCAGVPCQMRPRLAPVSPADRLALGGAHGCAIDPGGRLSCWGRNVFGELGRGVADADRHARPEELLVDGVTEVAAGRFHSCAVASGDVYCWGLGHQGQLALDPTTLSTCPVTPALAASASLPADATQAACALEPKKITLPGRARQVVSGDFQTCARLVDGQVLCWGANEVGQLALGTTASTAMPSALPLEGVVLLALGARHGCATDPRGRLYCWGANELAQLGIGSIAPEDCGGTPCRKQPTAVLDVGEVAGLALGATHSCARFVDGSARCWGSDAVGQLGNSSAPVDDCNGTACARRPTLPFGLTEVTDLAGGRAHSCAVAQGKRWCWGDGAAAQTGHGLQPVDPFPTPVFWPD